MQKKDRVLKSMNIEEPDRVPIMELDIEVPIMEAIIGEKIAATSGHFSPLSEQKREREWNDFKIKCCKKVDFDVFPCDLSSPEGQKPVIRSDGTALDIWGKILMLDKHARIWVPYGTIFNNPEDFENFELPRADSHGWTFSIEYAKKAVGDEMAIAASIREPFAQVWEMFTPTKFVTWMYQDPSFIRKVIEKLTDFNVEMIKRLYESGADFIVSEGDYCESKGPMVPLRFFREVIFPNLKRQVGEAHRRGIKFIKHTDGNINPLLEDLSKLVDGLHSLDPSAGVDIGKVKQKYGDRLILIGNVAVDSLATKDIKSVIAETKECIDKTSRGGGHILSSSNSWAAGAKVENCLAMVETCRRFGTYPIKIG